jgi:hypothetical protein
MRRWEAGPTHLVVLAADQTCVDVDGCQVDGAALLKVKVQQLCAAQTPAATSGLEGGKREWHAPAASMHSVESGTRCTTACDPKQYRAVCVAPTLLTPTLGWQEPTPAPKGHFTVDGPNLSVALRAGPGPQHVRAEKRMVQSKARNPRRRASPPINGVWYTLHPHTARTCREMVSM